MVEKGTDEKGADQRNVAGAVRSRGGGTNLAPPVLLERVEAQGMITLRADLADPALAAALKAAMGTAVPAPRQIARSRRKGHMTAWMSPDELLLFAPPEKVRTVLRALEKGLTGSHYLAADVSSARAVFRLAGNDGHLREILAKGTPADLAPQSLPLGEMRRTRLGPVAVGIWSLEPGVFHLMCFRSLAEHVELWLRTASHEGTAIGFM